MCAFETAADGLRCSLSVSLISSFPALPPPLNYDPAALSMHKPPIPGGVSGLKDYPGPTCFAIPGNRTKHSDSNSDSLAFSLFFENTMWLAVHKCACFACCCVFFLSSFSCRRLVRRFANLFTLRVLSRLARRLVNAAGAQFFRIATTKRMVAFCTR